jgi:uncharacterized protein YfcZ (UPF0381/DUF406 family)
MATKQVMNTATGLWCEKCRAQAMGSMIGTAQRMGTCLIVFCHERQRDRAMKRHADHAHSSWAASTECQVPSTKYQVRQRMARRE